MILDVPTGASSYESLLYQIGALTAGGFVFRQWIRSDIRKLESQRQEDRSSLDERIGSLEASLEKLADSVNTYVRTSTDDRLRQVEQGYAREKAVELKVAALEVNVATITNLLNRVGEHVSQLMMRVSGDTT